MSTRLVVIPVFDDAEILDITGPASVFANAAKAVSGGGYKVLLAAKAAGPVRTSSGLVLHAELALDRVPRMIDTLLVPGGEGTEGALGDARYVAAIRRLAARAARVASVCTGSFLLAQAGLLDGRRATTHWRYAAQMQQLFPRVQVESDPIFVVDGAIWTSAGVTAGLDLALALVEADHGRDLALQLARSLVFYLKRPGGQSQFSVPLETQAAQQPAIERIRQHVLQHPGADLRLPALAERAHVSERHLRRLFRRELALTPRAFVQQARLEQAQRLLCDSGASVREVARRCGYASGEAFARRFESRFKVSPNAYRSRFRPHPP